MDGAYARVLLRILPTKLFAPRRRQTTVARPELVARIEAGSVRPLTLVVAPAGFGKTTLITQWIDATRMPVAWLSLDRGDNDPLRFLSYLLAAVGRIRPEVSQLCGVTFGAGDVDLDALLAELLVIPLAEEAAPFALVLDDFHELDDRVVIEAVDRLLDGLPPCMHVVITSRVEPALSLAVRRARDAVTEIQVDDLAFNRADARAFFHDTMELALDDDAVGRLQQRTEGWVAGMQLAGLSMRRGAGADEVLRGLTADGDVADFLGKEILDVLEPAQRKFLLDTCVLERLCAPLCEAVTEQADAGEALRTAVRDGLFLVPLDHRRTWYRYHHLFGDILRRQLRAEAPAREAALLRRAARWWIDQDDPHGAASCAIRAEAHDLLGEIVERWGMPLLMISDRRTVEGWIAALPDRALDEHPMVGTLAAWLAVLPVRAPPRAAIAVAAVARARRALELTSLPPARRRELEGHLIAAEAIATRPVADLPGCVAHAEAALATLNCEADSARTVLALQLGVLHVLTGRPDEAITPLERAEAWGRASGNVFAGVAAIAYRAGALRWLGELDAAEEACRAAMVLAEQAGMARMGATAHVHVEAARLHLDRWELGDTLSSLEEALPRARLLSDPFLLVTALTLLARARAAAGELQLAEASAAEAVELAERSGHPLLRAWASPRPSLPTVDGYQPVAHDAAIAAVHGAIDAPGTVELARRLRDRCRAAGFVTLAIDWSVALAAGLAAAGRLDEAAPVLAEAIEQARPRRLVRPFVEASAWLAPVIATLPARARAFVPSPVAAAPVPRPAAPRRADLPPLAEPLSPRELEVLGLVREGRSNAEIACALFVSTGTIKTHMHRLMTKLDAKNRVEAIRIAEEHGLLD
jgi:LuxR family maltose regulon positive regulatory protein